jgi:acyl-coenzyme A thioesterase PaaI-like protein
VRARSVTHPLIAGTCFLWAPVVMAMADALFVFGVNHHWPDDAKSFTTVECKANVVASARAARAWARRRALSAEVKGSILCCGEAVRADCDVPQVRWGML